MKALRKTFCGCFPISDISKLLLFYVACSSVPVSIYSASNDVMASRGFADERCLADAREAPSSSFAAASHRSMKHLFMFAQFLNGVGATPLSVLAITFMDENVNRQFYSFCIAAYFLSTLIGPALGFLIGSFSLTYFVDLTVE